MTIYKKAENDLGILRIMYHENPESPREWDNLATMVYGHRRYILGDEEARNIDCYNNWDEWLEDEILKLNGGEDNVVWLPLYLYDHSGITMNTTGFSCGWDSGQVGWIYVTKDRLRKETGYTENELFSTNKHRLPEVGERVKMLGREGYGQVMEISKGIYTVDFDYNKAPNHKDPNNIKHLYHDDITEVMTDKAYDILRGEVSTFDDYIRGDVYGYIVEKKVKCDCCGGVKYEHVDSCWGFYCDGLEEDLKGHIPVEFESLISELSYY